jgi:RNA polymerase sigma-70 factor (ECF subfamily)
MADASDEQDAPALRQALDRLPPGHRQVLLLSEIGGFSTREIAAILAIPEGTVGSRKHAALKQLRDHLEPSP